MKKNFGPLPSLTPDRIRWLDRTAIDVCRVPGLLLMERASTALAALAFRRFEGALGHGVRVLVGRGNNGGDGLALARHLAILGVDVRVLCASERPDEPLSDSGQNRFLAALQGRHRFASLGELRALIAARERFPGLWVDALLGTGFHGSLRAPLDQLIPALNRRHEAVLAIDVPSGLDARTGQPSPDAVRSTVTGTLGARKTGFDAPASLPYLGEVLSLEIGWPAEVLGLAGADQG